ncbi:hypothetical protein WN59_09965 [Salinicoccus sediminis]|uniref:Uncharacterized protein n=1 Tax=Salinicoccus sediminis TaxID=1432562 RepID=A0A0M2SGT8_9STAP|nr:hypothetical protein WN59_09965 [Salinicoccus sediminis]
MFVAYKFNETGLVFLGDGFTEGCDKCIDGLDFWRLFQNTIDEPPFRIVFQSILPENPANFPPDPCDY